MQTLDEVLDDMGAERAERCARWLGRLGEWAGTFRDRPCAVACEVVRGIVDVNDDEYAAAVAWSGGKRPRTADWERALSLYGPVLTEAERSDRAERADRAAQAGDRWAVRAAVR